MIPLDSFWMGFLAALCFAYVLQIGPRWIIVARNMWVVYRMRKKRPDFEGEVEDLSDRPQVYKGKGYR